MLLEVHCGFCTEGGQTAAGLPAGACISKREQRRCEHEAVEMNYYDLHLLKINIHIMNISATAGDDSPYCYINRLPPS